ncbi:MAG TPA: hypothetical protein VEI02_03645, partial [Planctomycetota bacterium]|nr:hypothetical protein [Planctomycetota bacterium]
MLRAAARSLVDLLTAEGRLRRDHRLYDRRTFALIDRVLPVDGAAVDVGCHEGAVLRRILRRAPRGKHVAFEPLPAYAARLRSEFPGVEVRET